MCILCTKSYTTNIIRINCDGCRKVKKIPDDLTNLRYLQCRNTKIKKIPKTLINLQVLECYNTKIPEIPKELVNLWSLDCRKTKIQEIPKELINLTHLNCNKAKAQPPFYIESERIYLVTQDRSWCKTENEIAKIVKLQKYWKLYFKLYSRHPVLWKIAEYYMSKKYSPGNIIKYIDLE
jgi:Leucine-rich repeat (LRR) protein